MIDYTSTKINNEFEYLKSTRNEKLQFLQEIINSYIKKKYDKKFYNLILGDWLNVFSSCCHAVWIDEKINKNSDNTSLFSPNVANHNENFRSLMIEDKFIEDLYYLKKNFLNSPEKLRNISFKVYEKKEIKNFFFKNFLKKKIIKFCSFFSKKIFYSYTVFGISNNKNYLSNLIFLLTKFYFPDKTQLSKLVEIDSEWRIKKLNQMTHTNNQILFFQKACLIYLPFSLLENLEKNISIVKKKVDKITKPPKYIFSSYDLHGNLDFKLTTSMLKHRGSELIYIQHGGNYGTDYKHQFEDYEISCADKYISWGWKDKKVLPLPQPRVSKKTHRQDSKRLLLITNNHSANIYRFHFQPMGHIRVNKMREETINFVRNCKVSSEFFVRFRTYHFKGSNNFTKDLMTSNNHLKIDNYKNVFESMCDSKLSVHNYLGTSWLISIALDVPTVCFFDHEVYKFRPDFEMIAEKLMKNNIFKKSGKSAAEFISDIDINKWWNSEDVIKLRDQIKQNYIMHNDDWVDTWKKELVLD